MTFWWNCGSTHTHHTSPAEVDGIGFDDPAAENLIGLWDFTPGAETADTGLADGIAQNGTLFGDASTSSEALRLDGNGHFDTSGADTPFDLAQGTIMVQFSQDNHVGSSPDTIVSRGEYCDRDTEGHFNIQVTEHGAVTVNHYSGEELSLSTANGFFSAGDEVRVAYTWNEDGTGTFVVENVTDGTTHSEDFDSTGLSMDIGDNDDENFTFGARESDDGHYDQHFDGHIDYVAIFDTDVVNADGEGIVEGTDGDDLIDTAYTGDPDGDMIDNNDALLEGEVGDDDIVVAGAGDDTVLAGAGNDEVFGGAGNDTLDGADGNDVIYGDADSGNARVPTGETSRESFEWDLAGVADTGNLNGFTQDTGNVDVTFSYDTTGVTETEFSTDTQKVHSINTDGSSADANSSLDSETNGQGNTGTYALDFSDPVGNVSFRINDIDGDGIVSVRAYDADGNEINVDMSGGSHLTLIDSDGQYGADTADSNGGYLDDTAPEYSLLVDIPGPVARIVIEHTQDGSDNSGINVTDVYYDAPVFEVVDATGESGDDTITGGAGDDIIYGDNGITGELETGNLIVNGSFEDTTGMDTTGYGYVSTGAIAGWTSADPTQEIDVHNDGRGGVNPTDGNNWVDLEATPGNVTLEQNVAGAVTGEEYTLTFSAGESAYHTGNTIEVYWGGELVDTIDPIDGGMQDYTYTVVGGAGDGSNTLSFVGTGGAGDSRGASIDNVSLVGPIADTGDAGGNDTIIGGEGADIIYGEGGADTIIGGNAGDVVDGGSTGDDNDTLDLSTSGPLRIVDETTDPDGNSTSGTVEFLDSNGDVTGTMTFTEIETLILPENTGPVANNDTATVLEDGSVLIDVLGNDTDADGDDLTITGATVPAAQGTVEIVGNALVFTPADDFNGDATISYSIEDGNGGTDTATVTVDVTPVNDDPVAVDDAIDTDEDTAVIIDLIGNDTDVDGDPLTIGTVSVDPALGTVVDNGDGTATFTPANDYNGPVTIDYTVVDGQGGEDAGQAVISVGAVNDAPEANTDEDTTLEDTSITVDLIGNDTDPDGDPLTVITASVPADQGTLVNNGDGTVTFTPAENFNGDATISYEVSDGNGGTDTSEHTVHVTPVNDGPDAVNDVISTEEDTAVTIDVLGNDTDADGDDLTITGATVPAAQGTVEIVGNALVFTPADDFNGDATISYSIEDGNGGTDTATVTVDVTPVNDDPVAVDDVATVAFGTPTEIDVLGNDTDVDGDDLSILGTPTALHGTVTVTPDGTLIYTPQTGYDGPDTITYTVSDGNGGTDVGEVAITVEPTPLDGIVSGTDGDDIIDLAYTGDPEGDMVDAGDEIIAGEGPDDDIIRSGAGDDIVYGGAGNDDIVDEEGSDTVYGEDGDDIIDVSGPNSGPNTFDDIVADPSVLGDAGLDDTPLPDGFPYDSLEDANPTDDIDFVDGGDGDDTIITGDDADTIFGGAGNDTIYSGIDDDTVNGGAGDDIIIDVQGSDIVDGGAGDDYINVGTDTFSDYVGDDPALPNGLYPFASDQNTSDGEDIVHGGSGNDTILTGDDADIVYGDEGDDIIDAGIDDDEVYGGSGNDTITGGHGSDAIYGGSGDDIINAGDVDGVMNHTDETDDTDPVPTNDMDYVRGGGGNDTITGGDDADTLYGDAGDDYLDGGIDDDFLSGGDGADTIIGGQGDDTLVSDNDAGIDTLDAGIGNDTLFVGTNDIADAGEGDDIATVRGENATLDMGDGNDFVTVTNGADGADIDGGADRDVFDINNAPGTVADPSTMTIDGGSEGDDYDVLDLTGSVTDNGSFEVVYTSADLEDGIVTYRDEFGNTTGTLEFTDIENVIPCFTPGTMIATPKGEVDVASLEVGDKVITRDNGLQTIRWIGNKALSAAELMLRKDLCPVMIRQGALGNGLPERDMMVSPNHRMLVSSEKAALYFDDHEVLVAAKYLTKMDGVELLGTDGVTYIHVMFDRHEVILGDGTWSESFQPGDFTLAGIGEEQREEIFSLFPELREQSGRGHYETARRVLRKHEAELLVS